MDTLSLLVGPDNSHLFVMVNGKDLGEVLAECDPIPDRCITFETLDRFRDDTILTALAKPRSRLVVLECGCGEIACSNTTIEVTRDDNSVMWSGFARGWQEPEERFRNVGPFTFHMDEYEAAIHQATKAFLAWKKTQPHSHQATLP